MLRAEISSAAIACDKREAFAQGSEATKAIHSSTSGEMDCFASLAMTWKDQWLTFRRTSATRAGRGAAPLYRPRKPADLHTASTVRWVERSETHQPRGTLRRTSRFALNEVEGSAPHVPQ